MAAWGIVSGLTATVQDFRGLVTVRFFLGFVEALVCAILPALNCLLTIVAHTFRVLSSYYPAGTPVKSWPCALPFSMLVAFCLVGLVGLWVQVYSTALMVCKDWNLGEYSVLKYMLWI